MAGRDRIFRNTKTGEMVISAPKGVMPISPHWVRVGTINLKACRGEKPLVGRIRVS